MISKRMIELGSRRSCIRELFEYGREQVKTAGPENVYDFSLGNPSVPSPAAVNEAIREILRDKPSIQVHGYTSAAGCDEAQEAIAMDLNRRFGTNYTADAIYISCGAAVAVTACFKALTIDQSTEFIAFAPYFPEYAVFAPIAGAKLKIIPPSPPSFQINFSALEQALTPNTQGIIVNSPNNPTGVVYSEETIERLAALLAEKSARYGHPVYLISDEPYRELVYDGIKLPFIPSYYKNTIVCYSYSKSLSLPGERIGYVLMPDSLTDARDIRFAVAGAARALGCVCAPSLMQRVIARCAQAGITPDLASYQKNRDLLYGALSGMGYRCAKPSGAFYLFVEAPNGNSQSFSMLARSKNLLIVPADDFGCPGWVRLSYCVDYDMIRRSLPAFEELLKESQEKR